MAEPARLTPADQALVNALAFLACADRAPGWSDADMTMARAVLRDLLPHVSADHPQIVPLVAAAETVLGLRALGPDGPVTDSFVLRGALAPFFRWRLGGALDAMKPARAAP